MIRDVIYFSEKCGQPLISLKNASPGQMVGVTWRWPCRRYLGDKWPCLTAKSMISRVACNIFCGGTSSAKWSHLDFHVRILIQKWEYFQKQINSNPSRMVRIFRVNQITIPIADETNANAFRIIWGSMSTDHIETTTLIYLSISTNKITCN